MTDIREADLAHDDAPAEVPDDAYAEPEPKNDPVTPDQEDQP
jgi:hypothetical protein